MKQALLLIDLQNDYFPGGNMELVEIEKAAMNANRLIEYARNTKLEIFHIQHISTRPEAGFFLPNTDGVEINKLVSPLPSETVIQKHFPNSFRQTELLLKLKSNEVSHLLIAGAMSHMCIDATTRAAVDYEFNCTVIEDACATKDLKHNDITVSAKYVHAGFMSALNGIYAKIISFHNFYQERKQS